VRGTTRDPERVAEIEATGAAAVVADPDRLGTLLPHVEGVSVVVWLLGSVVGEAAATIHGPRLESMLEALVDTPVRGVVYEGPAEHTARKFAETFRVRLEVLGDGDDPAAAVTHVLA
jgi:hypothetical protein